MKGFLALIIFAVMVIFSFVYLGVTIGEYQRKRDAQTKDAITVTAPRAEVSKERLPPDVYQNEAGQFVEVVEFDNAGLRKWLDAHRESVIVSIATLSASNTTANPTSHYVIVYRTR